MEFTSGGHRFLVSLASPSSGTAERHIALSRSFDSLDFRSHTLAEHYPPERAEFFLQISAGFAIGFGEVTGHLVEIDVWDLFSELKICDFSTKLPLDYSEVSVRCQTLSSGVIWDLSESLAYVDVRKGVVWTGSMDVACLLRVGKNVYLAISEGGIPIRVAIALPPEELRRALPERLLKK